MYVCICAARKQTLNIILVHLEALDGLNNHDADCKTYSS